MKYLVLVFIAMSQAAHAGALSDQKKWDPIDEKIKKSTDSVATADYCGGAVAANLDKGSFKGDAIDAASWCAAVIDGVGSFCNENAKSKAEILKAVKTVKCIYDASLKGTEHWGTKFDLKGTTLEARWNKDSSNLQEETKKFLTDKL